MRPRDIWHVFGSRDPPRPPSAFWFYQERRFKEVEQVYNDQEEYCQKSTRRITDDYQLSNEMRGFAITQKLPEKHPSWFSDSWDNDEESIYKKVPVSKTILIKEFIRKLINLVYVDEWDAILNYFYYFTIRVMRTIVQLTTKLRRKNWCFCFVTNSLQYTHN